MVEVDAEVDMERYIMANPATVTIKMVHVRRAVATLHQLLTALIACWSCVSWTLNMGNGARSEMHYAKYVWSDIANAELGVDEVEGFRSHGCWRMCR